MHVHQALRAGFTVVLGAIFFASIARTAISEPAPAYNCGDRGVRYCIGEYSNPNSRTSETAQV
jgi:hypothetical protein